MKTNLYLTSIACLLLAQVILLSPAYAQRTTPVTVQNTPTVKIDSTANDVKIDNTANTVKIDNANNTVKSPTLSKSLQLLTSSSVLAPGATLIIPPVYCGGYKEARYFITLTSYAGANLSLVSANLFAAAPNGTYIAAGHAAFDSTANTSANFSGNAGRCIFSVPVLSDLMQVNVTNSNTTASVTVSVCSWVYLVN